MSFILSIFIISTFTLISQEWEESTPLPAGTVTRNHPITFSIGQHGYYMTGYGSDDRVHKDVYRFDSESQTWEQLEDFPGLARGFSYGVEHNGIGYVGFGLWFEGQSSAYLNDLWSFDPETEEWTQLPSCPCDGRRHPALVAANNKIFVGLGDKPGENLKDWWEYNIETQEWRQLPDLPGLERHHPYYFAVDNDVYVGLGHGTRVDVHGKRIYKSWFKWDTETDEWTQLNDFPGVGRVAGTQFSYDGKGYVLSGQDDEHSNFPEGEFYQYDPVEDTWSALPSHPGTSSRWAPGSFVIDGYVYFTSGRSNFDPVVEHADLLRFKLPSSLASVEEGEQLFSVFPNPVSSKLYINTYNVIDNIVITDILGNVVFESNQNITEVNLENFAEGTYLVNVTSNSKSQIKKIQVTR